MAEPVQPDPRLKGVDLLAHVLGKGTRRLDDRHAVDLMDPLAEALNFRWELLPGEGTYEDWVFDALAEGLRRHLAVPTEGDLLAVPLSEASERVVGFFQESDLFQVARWLGVHKLPIGGHTPGTRYEWVTYVEFEKRAVGHLARVLLDRLSATCRRWSDEGRIQAARAEQARVASWLTPKPGVITTKRPAA